MKKVSHVITIICMLFLSTYNANADQCPSYKKADMLISNLYNSWDNIFYYYKNYGECLDGYFGEGVTDAIVVRLSKHWDELYQLKSKIQTMDGFEDFILYNVNGTADEDDLQNIITSSKTACPIDMSDFCKKLGKAAEEGYEEINSL